MQRDLRAALDAFVASHRGLRVGKLFGSAAAFAGRRVFARLDNDGLRLRLPPSLREPTSPPACPPKRATQRRRRAARGRKGGRRAASWITITPRSAAAQRLEILLEQAARHVALS